MSPRDDDPTQTHEIPHHYPTQAIKPVWDYLDERSKTYRGELSNGEVVYNIDLRERSERVLKTVHDFAFTRIEAPALYDVASVYGILEVAQNRDVLRQKNARTALAHYNNPRLYSKIDEQNREHFAAIASDCLLIDQYVEQHHLEFQRQSQTEGRSSRFGYELSSISSYPPIDINEIASFLTDNDDTFPECEGINIESVLLKAAATLDSLIQQYESESPDLSELTRLIYSVETFYAPVCEIIGYDALAMALRDYALRIRIMQSDPIEIIESDGGIEKLTGKQRVERAQAAIETLGSIKQVEQTVTAIVDVTFGDSVSVSSIENSSGHNAKYGVGTVEFAGTDGQMRNVKFRWRIKSIGSLAKKYEKYASPLDLIGITLVTGNEPVEDAPSPNMQEQATDEVAELFAHMVDAISQSDTFTPTPTPDRDIPFVVEGSKQYIDAMNNATGDNYEISLEKRTNGFQIAKATMIYEHTMPVEIGIQTLQDRKIARIGSASHWVYKLFGRDIEIPDESLEALLHLSTRKHTVNHGPTMQSQARAALQLREIDAAPPPHIGTREAALAAHVLRHPHQ